MSEKIIDQLMGLLGNHTTTALAGYRQMAEVSIAQQKKTYDPPVVAVSIGEHTDTTAFAIVGFLSVDTAVEEVSRHFKSAGIIPEG